MKRFATLLPIMLITISQVFSQTHFVEVWSGNGVDHMNFYISSATIDGSDLEIDDEIAVFDGDLCVGVATITGTGIVSIEASKDDPVTPGVVDGYTTGNAASFRLWDASEGAEITDISVDLTGGSLDFAAGASAFVNLEGTSPSSTPLVSNSDTAFMQYTTESITIDGVDDEGIWQSMAPIPVTNFGGDPLDDPSDFAVEFKACWSDEDLYLLFDVTDGFLTNDHELPWQNDVVSIFFDMNNSRNVFEEGGHWHAYDHDDSQTHIVWESGELSGNQYLDGIEFHHNTYGGGYGLEIRIPRHMLCPIFGVGQWFGFDITVADNDGGGGAESWYSWHSFEEDPWRNPSVFGVGRLTDGLGQLPVEGTAYMTYDGYFHPSGYYFYKGRIPVSNEEILLEFPLYNIGQNELNISGYTVDGNGLGTFLGINPGIGSYLNGESGVYGVQYFPTDPGVFLGHLEVASNDPSSPYRFEFEYEVDNSRTIYVSTAGNDDSDGTELNPYRNINHALNLAIDGDTILVEPGTYTENLHISLDGKNVILASRFFTTGNQSYISQTIIDGNQQGRVVHIEEGCDDLLLTGFTIRNGETDSNAGIECNGSPTLEYLVVENNHSFHNGGGMGILRGNAQLSNITMRDNICDNDGGGIIIWDNAHPTITNTLISGNSSGWRGAGIWCGNQCNPSLVNVTISNNKANGHAGAILCEDNSNISVTNSIIWGNSPNELVLDPGNPSSFTLSYTDLPEGRKGIENDHGNEVFLNEGMISQNPLFQEESTNNYQLQLESICIDAGDPDPGYNDPDGTRNDMGAFGGPGGISYTYEDGPPALDIVGERTHLVLSGDPDIIQVSVWDALSTVSSVQADIRDHEGNPITDLTLYDDGSHDDGEAGDSIYGNLWTTPAGTENTYDVHISAEDDLGHTRTLNDAIVIQAYTPGIIYASESGSDDTGDGSELNPYRNINHAVHMAFDGDTIYVLPGTYNEIIHINDKEVVLTSEYMFTDSFSSIENTIITGDENEPVIGIYNTTYTEIVGFTITNGNHAILVDNSSPLIRNNVLKNSHTTGLMAYGASSPRILNNLIIYNSHDGIIFSQSDGEAINNTLYNNAHHLPGGEAGAIACRDNSNPVIKNNIMFNNHSFGVYVTDGAPVVSYNNVYGFSEAPYDNVSSTGGEMELNPLFYDIAHENFRLQIVSPCIDAGDPDPMYNDPDGTRNDMGAFGGPGGISYTYEDGPPHIEYFNSNPQVGIPGAEVIFTAFIWDAVSLVASAEIEIENPDESPIANVTLYDDGAHSDGAPGDSIFGNVWTIPGSEDTYFIDIFASDDNANETSIDNIHELQTRIPGIIYVSTEGSDDTGDGSLANPYRNINHGINQSVDGDTILVLEGTYFENIWLWNRSIVLGSQFLTTGDPQYISQTIIDGNYNGTVLGIIGDMEFDLRITGFTIQNGEADWNAGISCSGSPRLDNLIIENNYSHNNGGGIGINTGEAELSNIIIRNNGAGNVGGGMVLWDDADPTIENTLITGNTSGNRGAGIWCVNQCDPILTNVTINNNGAGELAGAILCADNSTMLLTNSIVWGNVPNEIVLDDGNPVSVIVSYSDLAGGESGIVNEYGNEVFWLEGNIDQAPLFYNTAEEDYTLQMGSPCIDAGNPDPGYNDLDDTRNDMGAYGGPGGTSYAYGDGPPVVELVGTTPHIVIAGDTDIIQVRVWDVLGTVSSVQAEIQEADETPITSITLYDDGTHGDEVAGDSIYANVWVTPLDPAGYWIDVTAVDNNASSVTINNIIRLVGVSADIFYVDQSNSTGTEDGSLEYPFLTIQQAVDLAGQYDTIRVAEGTYNDPVNFHRRSFVVEGGYNNVAWERDIELYPTIIDGNHSHVPVTIGGSSPVMDGFVIQHGWSDQYGGAGIEISGGDLVLLNSTLQNNEGTGVDEWGSGGICINNGDLHVINCRIINNHSPGGAGGLRAAEANILIKNSLFANNTGNMVMHFNHVNGSIVNSTLADNQEGFGFFDDSPIEVNNSIIWNNNHSYGSDLDHFRFTNIESPVPGDGNISVNPLFVDPAVNDYKLQLGSPCIDAGDPDPSFNDVDGSRNDMGAYGGPQGIDYVYEDGGPQVDVWTETPQNVVAGESVQITAYVWDPQTTVASVVVEIANPGEPPFTSLTLFDDGAHEDGAPGDSIYGNAFVTGAGNVDFYVVDFVATDDNANSRILDNAIEINTYLPGTIYVDQNNSTGTEDGTINHPYLTIQQAIDSSTFGDTIKVAAGTYVENLYILDKKVILLGGHENLNWQSNPASHPTVVDGGGINVTVMLDNSSSEIEGFTIQNGFKENYGGGGIESHGGRPLIHTCIIQNNHVTGIDEGGGGAMNFYGGDPTIINCQILNNGSPEGAGGIRAGGCGYIRIINTLMANNTGDICIQFSDLSGEFINCTLYGNEGGGFGFWESDVKVTNCIQWANNNNNWGDFSQVIYTNWEGGMGGPGNMDSDPLFVDPAIGDFTLSDASPSINRGLFDISELNLPDIDLAGSPREFGGRIDMGAYENQNVSLPPTDLEVLHWSDPWNRCDMDATEPVTIWVRNIGLETQDDYMLSYSNNGGTTFVTETVNIPIQPADTLVYTFTQDGDFSAFGDYDCIAAVSVAGDADTGNDTLSVLVSGKIDLSAEDYYMGVEWDDPNLWRYRSEDLNEDGNTWDIRSWVPKSGENSYACWGSEMDDWLYSHCFYLESSKTYGVAFQVMKYYDRPGVSLELKAGMDPLMGSMTFDLLEITDFEPSSEYNYVLAQLSVPASGVYYLGWHAINISGEWNYLFMDEIEVFEMDDYDVLLSDPVIHSEYSMLPLRQVQPVYFGANVLNKGILDVTQVTVDVQVNGVPSSASDALAVLAPGKDSLLSTVDSFTPDAVGTYDIDFLATVSEPESNIQNNTGYQQLVISDSIYAKDNGNLSSGIVSNSGGFNGNSFEIVRTDTLTSISVRITSANVGDSFSFAVYEDWSEENVTVGPLLFESPIIPITSDQMLSELTSDWNTFALSEEGVVLNPGTYAIGITTFDPNDVVIGRDDSPNGNSINFNTGQWNFIEGRYLLLRANFSDADDCKPSAGWTVNPADYEFSGQVSAKVFVNDLPVETGYLAAFVGDECRSMAVEPLYFESENHFVFEVICYSNLVSGETVTFKYFDSNECLVLEPFTESVEFVSNMIVGNAVSPFELHYPGEATYDKSFVTGWNWFSVNVLNDDMSLGNLLSCASEGDYIKNQTISAQYYEGIGWFGALANTGLDPVSMYKLKTANPCGANYKGIPVDVISTPVDLAIGWNWIGYLPQCPLPIEDALSSLVLEESDYIKNQTISAQYYEGIGWFGHLDVLEPTDGYMLKKQSADQLNYPECPPAEAEAMKGAEAIPSAQYPSLDPHRFEFSGTVTARVYVDGMVTGGKEDLVLAYVDDQLRGVMGGLFFEPTESYVYPMMVYSNLAEGETVTFRYYSSENKKLYACEETLVFSEDMIVADAIEAFELHVGKLIGFENFTQLDDLSLTAYPNPAFDHLQIEYSINKRSRVRMEVYDMLGRVVEILEAKTIDPGSYSRVLSIQDYKEGSYVIRITSESDSKLQKIIIMK